MKDDVSPKKTVINLYNKIINFSESSKLKFLIHPNYFAYL